MVESIKGRVILSSSDPVYSDTGSTFFKDRGYEFFTTSDDRELLRTLEDIKPDAVILDDDNIIELVGFRTYEIIKKLDRFKEIKVYILSYANPSIHIIDGWIDKGKMEDSLNYFFIHDEKVGEEIGACQPAINEDVHATNSALDSDPYSRPRNESPTGDEQDLAIHEKAKRLAHAIVSDIYLYNTDKFEHIHSEDDFYRVLKDDIERGRRLYHNKIPEGLLSRDYFEETLQDLMRHKLYTS